jgi:hypothetical protein
MAPSFLAGYNPKVRDFSRICVVFTRLTELFKKRWTQRKRQKRFPIRLNRGKKEEGLPWERRFCGRS